MNFETLNEVNDIIARLKKVNAAYHSLRRGLGSFAVTEGLGPQLYFPIYSVTGSMEQELFRGAMDTIKSKYIERLKQLGIENPEDIK